MTPRRRSVDKVSCPSCGFPVSAVRDSRGAWRLRVCDGCGASYETAEAPTRLLPRGQARLTVAAFSRTVETKRDI